VTSSTDPTALTVGHAIAAFVLGIAGGVLSNFLIQTWNTWSDRRKFSRLGASVVDSLLAQVDLGIGMLTRIADGEAPGGLMPHSSWYGMETIPNDVLLRIIATDRGDTTRGPGAPLRPRDIRIHCNNYFVNVCGNMNNLLDGWYNPNSSARGSAKTLATQYEADARQVECMLRTARSLLERNGEKLWCPE